MSQEIKSFGPEGEEVEKVGDGAIAPTDSLENSEAVVMPNAAEVASLWQDTTEENRLEVDKLGNSAPGETSYVEQLRQMVSGGQVRQVSSGHSGDSPDMVAQLMGDLVRQIERVKEEQVVIEDGINELRDEMTTDDLPDGFESDSFRKRRDI